ncbi:MAG: hypothetical protein HBSAPP03_07450 [Phycisphaerae bacterium]|nr:MAG: hypothetical protein HBSAPP03_07450 [Phycisphaerae bacterium]
MFEISQIADIGNSIDPGPLNALSACSLAQLLMLDDLLREHMSITAIPQNDCSVAINLDGTAIMRHPYSEWEIVLATEVASRGTPSVAYDINKDGVFDGLDLIGVYDSWISASDGHLWLSSADVDGDGFVSIGDVCVVEGALAEE